MGTRNFEDRLLTELREVVESRPAPAPAALKRSRLRLVVAAAVAAVVAATVSILIGVNTSPAFAVFREPDGSIRISVYDYRDPAGLEKRIEAFGIPAAVDYLPAGMTCRESRADFVPAAEMPLAMVDWAPLASEDHYFKVHPEYIGPGQTFVYTVQMKKGDQRAAIRLANGPVAACDPVPGELVPGRR
ncbi:hypothetical protein FB565_000468 [Actinoplanes lutulentus]|uniref:Uncharacterized protein n=1 Tax=Actinoplanes lutulentus TaxID=1287878 RepID=A0A327ZNY0_9ACTN|nr:hypothetical protein [Actinoplanes lutulentus]MBB2940764.1 hypothetical protein [Actinoplanes lutulentus]RAK43074.1 hypothetical protein B0I29_101204 [Actinoplanes lutulentus]